MQGIIKPETILLKSSEIFKSKMGNGHTSKSCNILFQHIWVIAKYTIIMVRTIDLTNMKQHNELKPWIKIQFQRWGLKPIYVYNDQTAMLWNLSVIHGEIDISRKSKDLTMCMYAINYFGVGKPLKETAGFANVFVQSFIINGKFKAGSIMTMLFEWQWIIIFS